MGRPTSRGVLSARRARRAEISPPGKPDTVHMCGRSAGDRGTIGVWKSRCDRVPTIALRARSARQRWSALSRHSPDVRVLLYTPVSAHLTRAFVPGSLRLFLLQRCRLAIKRARPAISSPRRPTTTTLLASAGSRRTLGGRCGPGHASRRLDPVGTARAVRRHVGVRTPDLGPPSPARARSTALGASASVSSRTRAGRSPRASRPRTSARHRALAARRQVVADRSRYAAGGRCSALLPLAVPGRSHHWAWPCAAFHRRAPS